ncbi:MAG TPA: hypothetical protein VKA40_03855 [Nitrososphaera sp.]|nr:hypothetical protein [Nitrososphaera sp.]
MNKLFPSTADGTKTALDNNNNNRFHRKTAPIILKDQEERREGARERICYGYKR